MKGNPMRHIRLASRVLPLLALCAGTLPGTAQSGQRLAGSPTGVVVMVGRNPSDGLLYAVAVDQSGNLQSSPAGSSTTLTQVPCNGATTIALASANTAYRITPTANCTLSLTAPTGSGFYRYDFFIVGSSYTVTLPPASAGVQTWTNGTPPSSPAAGQYVDTVVKWYGAAPLSGTY